MRRVPRLGVGIVWLPALAEVVAQHADLFDLIEIEPQTLWLRGADGRVWTDRPRLDRVRATAANCLVHGVGYPVGTSRSTFPEIAGLFSEAVDRLHAPWASEHLSFTRGSLDGNVRNAGFLLPPAQTDAGVSAACRAIIQAAGMVEVPFAVENGVSYLRRRPREMDDGAFLRAVVEAADCGIVLDLHNAWCNDKNGRQPIDRFLGQLPLERVVEVHLAGGHEYRGYWLDAHSGAVPGDVMSVAADLLGHLPNLGAVVFELSPSGLKSFEEADILREIERIRGVWPPARPAVAAAAFSHHVRPGGDVSPAACWEDSLVAALAGRRTEWDGDPGIDVYRQLILEFRQSTIATILPFTSRYMMLKLGIDVFEALLDETFTATAPDPFATAEATSFGARASVLLEGDPVGSALLSFELALVSMLTSGIAKRFEVSGDLVGTIVGVTDGKLTEPARTTRTRVEMSPAGVEFRDQQGVRIASWTY